MWPLGVGGGLLLVCRLLDAVIVWRSWRVSSVGLALRACVRSFLLSVCLGLSVFWSFANRQPRARAPRNGPTDMQRHALDAVEALPLSSRLAVFDKALSRAHMHMKERDDFANRPGFVLSRRLVARNFSTSFNSGVLMQPVFECPLDLVKTRGVRLRWDGGKWMCGLSFLGRTRPCVVYSIGSNFDDTFESDVQRLVRTARAGTGCDVEIYDPTLEDKKYGSTKIKAFREKLAKERTGSLHLIGLSGDAALKGRAGKLPMLSLPQMLASNNHTCVDVLKIDVDGAESSTLRDTDWSSMCIGMLLLEHHGKNIQKMTGKAYTIGHALANVRRLEQAGLLLYSQEVVCPYCDGATELAFVNVTWAREMMSVGQ